MTTLRIKNNKMQDSLLLFLIVLQCSGVQSSSDVGLLMEAFIQSASRYHEHTYIFSMCSSSGNPPLTLALLKQRSHLGAAQLQCFTLTRFKSASKSTVRSLCFVSGWGFFSLEEEDSDKGGLGMRVHAVIWNLHPTLIHFKIPFQTKTDAIEIRNHILLASEGSL